ncbi:MAG: transposase, partial [Candidatus Entotheonellia bacterium]
YAMIIGMRPGSAMRAIGEIDYENARLIAGRTLQEEDIEKPVALVGKLYAKQRLGLAEPTDAALAGREISLNGKQFRVVGVYTTDNDFGDSRRRRHHEFLELLQALRARWPKGKLVIVLDNLSIHTTPAIRAWLQDQGGRVRFEWLPLHASWLNQIDLWFSMLERQALRRASDAAYHERAARIYRLARHWNRIAHPFRRTFKGYPLCR